MKKKRYNLYLTKPQLEALKALKEKTGLSIAEIVRRAIDGYLEQRELSVEKFEEDFKNALSLANRAMPIGYWGESDG